MKTHFRAILTFYRWLKCRDWEWQVGLRGGGSGATSLNKMNPRTRVGENSNKGVQLISTTDLLWQASDNGMFWTIQWRQQRTWETVFTHMRVSKMNICQGNGIKPILWPFKVWNLGEWFRFWMVLRGVCNCSKLTPRKLFAVVPRQGEQWLWLCIGICVNILHIIYMCVQHM